MRKSDWKTVVLVALGFGCLFGYSRLFALGFDGLALPGIDSAEDATYLVRSLSRVIAFILLAGLCVAGRTVSARGPVVISMFGMAVGSVCLGLCGASALGYAGTAVAGFCSGVIMVAWTLELVEIYRRSAVEMVVSSICSLLVGGLCIMFLPRASGVVALVVLAAMCLISGLALAKLDGSLELTQPAGSVRGALPGSGWLAVALILVCGWVDTVMYGAVSSAAWTFGDPVIVPLFLVLALVTVVLTAVLTLQKGSMLMACWIPLFVLTVVGLMGGCLSGVLPDGVAVSLLLPCVFCAHYLRWLAYPAIVAQARESRALISIILLTATSGFLGSHVGELIVGPDPQEVILSALACGLCIVLLMLFVAASAFKLIMSSRKAASAPESTDCDAFAAFLSEAGLSAREKEIADLTARGHSAAAIAQQLFISGSTVRFHQQNSYKKLGVHSKQELVELRQSIDC